MAVDFEQWWAVWGQWYQAVAHKVTWAMVRRIAPRIISRRGHAMAAWFDEHTDLPVVVYTSYGFVSSYAGEAASWLGRYPSWISHWKEQPATRVRLSWEQIRESWLPRYEPLCPPGVLSPAVVGHQFSGDRILAPGVYTDPAGTVAGPTDLSVFDREWLARI
jgi:hypothetical protein